MMLVILMNYLVVLLYKEGFTYIIKSISETNISIILWSNNSGCFENAIELYIEEPKYEVY